ncbi:thioredoxin reductase (NADPH) [Keratinibaculum paraultunense]|uniref:Thioredoxin reductase n=1 Tax=Keratinibaculum paraultunense TaxID=1278232 RepID=A0A4R3KSN0_9FIRM|nr:thioredoxin-disulfide reductase [Keratinibaculum paraultunense]QQY79564.1 thioredoxin-disulfide reductase [Keratinibaculum paraultunense]TCS87589.1 thioredoxin reductase (NADPH) [Keratinibaculum paraultunense]
MAKKDEYYDVVIIGGGPAGLTAGIYCGRSRLKTIILEQGLVGGLITSTEDLENYPGFPNGIGGEELMNLFYEQAKKFGVDFKFTNVKKVDFNENEKIAETFRNIYHAKSIIIATGAKPKRIGCKGEEELIGKGISFCSTCDANLCIGKEVYVIGGGDSAVEEAIYLTKFADKVTIIHRRDELRAAKSIQEKAFKCDKLDFMWNTVVKEIKGKDKVEAMVVENVKTGEKTTITPKEGNDSFMIFPYVGLEPATSLFKDIINMENGFIKTNENMETNIPGVFAAGDCRVKPLRQVVTAAADGAIAAFSAENYINTLSESLD